MRAQLARMVAALCAGRDPAAVIAMLAMAFALAAALWASACVFLAMEPGA